MNKKIIFWIIVGILALMFIGGLVMSIISENMCGKECDKLDALAHEVYPSGNWKFDDVCICFYEDKIKSWRMGN